MSTVTTFATSGRFLGHGVIRAIFLAVAMIIFALNISAFFSWNERGGVHDSICYLRQAHLFQRFGLSGIDTDLRRDNDGFLQKAQLDIGLTPEAHPGLAICHTSMPSGKQVIQYPPGTGFIMAAFPAGSQVAWLYTTSMLVVMSSIIFLILLADTRASIIFTGLFGLCALYLMVNPTKASYSMAPTTVLCIVAAILSPLLFLAHRLRYRLLMGALVGLLLGLSVSFRTANLLLVTGYVVVLAFKFLQKRDRSSFAVGASFAVFYSIGLLPSLVANYVNAGSPFATTYSAQDTAPLDLTFSAAAKYLRDLQGYLVVLSAAGTVWMLRNSRCLAPVLVVAINLVINVGFFFAHPLVQQYYIMPTVTLALWALLAQWLFETRQRPLGM